jgi:hypothetical protein
MRELIRGILDLKISMGSYFDLESLIFVKNFDSFS